MDELRERLARFLYDNDGNAESGWPDWGHMADTKPYPVYGHEPGKSVYLEEADAILQEIGRTHDLVLKREAV